MSTDFGKLQLKIFPDKMVAGQNLASDLSETLLKYKEEGTQVLLFFSGGSALPLLDYVDSDALGENLTITALDERYDVSGKESNFIQMLTTKFHRNAKESRCMFIDSSSSEYSSKEELADYMDKEIGLWQKKNKGGVLIAVAGMGSDGHTAGIMPYPEDTETFQSFFESEKLYVGYDATGRNSIPLRATATNTLIRKFNKVFVYITGEKKSNAFCDVLKEGSVVEIPARVLKEIPGTIYIDSKLAKDAYCL